jgi:ornithine carbamoyltransferase
MDVRLCGPKSLWPAATYVDIARQLQSRSGARLTITDDVATAVKGVDFVHTDVWVSMGEPHEVWKERIDLLSPYQVNADVLKASGNAQVKFMHCLPAFHDSRTATGKQIASAFGLHNGQRRLRPGREPHAHHQGPSGRHAGRLNHAHRGCARRQRAPPPR